MSNIIHPLKIENDNNKFSCNAFLQIHFAPPKESVREKDFDKIFCIKHEGKDIFVKCTDFLRIPFGHIGGVFTLPAAGLDMQVWRAEWLRKYPNTKEDTEMAIYTYVKTNL